MFSDHSVQDSQKLVDFRSRLAHRVLQVPVERLHHLRDTLAADRLFVLYNAIPDVAVGLPSTNSTCSETFVCMEARSTSPNS
jgi:hypothetical protein